MKNEFKFADNEWYKHVHFKDLVVKIIKRITDQTFEVELFTLGYNPKKPTPLGVCRTYCFDNDKDWVKYEPK